MTVFHGASDHDLLQATGTLVEMPRPRKKSRALCPYDRRPCRYPRCALCRHGRLRWLDHAVGVGAALLAGLGGAVVILAIGLALVVLIRDLG